MRKTCEVSETSQVFSLLLAHGRGRRSCSRWRNNTDPLSKRLLCGMMLQTAGKERAMYDPDTDLALEKLPIGIQAFETLRT